MIKGKNRLKCFMLKKMLIFTDLKDSPKSRHNERKEIDS